MGSGSLKDRFLERKQYIWTSSIFAQDSTGECKSKVLNRIGAIELSPCLFRHNCIVLKDLHQLHVPETPQVTSRLGAELTLQIVSPSPNAVEFLAFFFF